ncbi:contractile injection system tape measure protein [Flavobacterium sp.]|uniref:contractile injection system tape measure protein n=1 Tax=Flavobacterium sp. TaxID=239 RepID=UPI00261D5EAE|nr:contractile injection system tape measure protein [Flavobacterium sp.]
MSTTTLPTNNAGMVLINAYFPMLLDRLGLIKNKAFTSEENREKAVLYLNYLATGRQNTDDHQLSLNKILCGIAPDTVITQTIEVTDQEEQLMNGLLKTMINYWPAIGSSSIAGFRGNWLIRDGMLTDKSERWELKVEKRAYDILINRASFSFSIIKYPWMIKPVYVEWNY